MSPFSFIFAGTSPFALDCLKCLMKQEFLSLKGLVTRPGALQKHSQKNKRLSLSLLVKGQGMPVWMPQKTSDPDFLKNILQQKCDFCFVCAYGRILPKDYLNIFPQGCLNLHLSLLPRWRGAAPVQRALMAGDTQTGVCLQLMTEELDAGDIIGQREFVIQDNDNAKDIFDRSLEQTKFLVKEELQLYLQGKRLARPQPGGPAIYARKIDKAECEINWEADSQQIHNQIRALFLGPQAFSFFQGQRIKIYQSRILKTSFPDFAPGEVCGIERDRLYIACGKGGISLLEVQREGKKRLKIKDFLRGCRISLKTRFR